MNIELLAFLWGIVWRLWVVVLLAFALTMLVDHWWSDFTKD